MTQQDREAQRELILARIDELEGSLGYLTEETKAIEPSVSLGRLTRMEALNDKGVNEHVLAENRKSLERLRNALGRIEDGSYGQCIRCGSPIPMERLRLVPEALICVPCSEKKAARR
jgi:DnaK suppressor protein